MFTITEVAPARDGTPAHFLLERPVGGAPQAEEDLARLIEGCVAQICDVAVRTHVKIDEWMQLLRGLAGQGLVAPGGAPADVVAEAVTLRNEIARDLRRFFDAAFVILLDLDTYALHVTPRDGVAEPTADQLAFLEELLGAEHFMVMLYKPSLRTRAPKAEKDVVYKRLAGAAEIALGRVPPATAAARAALKSLVRDAIRDRGGPVRDAYLAALFCNYLMVLGVVAAGMFLYHAAAHPADYLPWTDMSGGAGWTLPQSLVIPGRMLLFIYVALLALVAGAWLSAASRIDTSSPEVLSTMLGEGDPTRARAFMVIGFGLIALLLLHTGLVTVAVGTGDPPVFTTAKAMERFSFALLTGCLLGLGERTLPTVINKRAADFVAALGSAGGR